MKILVLGGSGSGKSAYAEQLVLKMGKKKRYYLATMQVFDEEGLKKIERHRILRKEKDFFTIEQPKDIGIIARYFEEKGKDAVVLLECVSNLVSNELFDENGIVESENLAKKICTEIFELWERVDDFVIVSNNVFEDGVVYEDTTRRYIELLGTINATLAAKADQVIEVVCGIPVKIK